MNHYKVTVTRYVGMQEVCCIRVDAKDEWEAREVAAREAQDNPDIGWDFVDGWDLAGYDKEYDVELAKKAWPTINFHWLGIALLEMVVMCIADAKTTLRLPHESGVWMNL